MRRSPHHRLSFNVSTSSQDIHAGLTSGDMKASLYVGSSPTVAQKDVTLLLDETLRQIELITSGKSATSILRTSLSTYRRRPSALYG